MDTNTGQANKGVNITEIPSKGGGSPSAVLIVVASLALMFGGSVLTVLGGIRLEAAQPAGGFLLTIGIIAFLASFITFSMVVLVNPGQTAVVQFFGNYTGTIRRTGLSTVTPLSTRKKVSVKVRNFETGQLKVNDLNGNPINIAAIVVWQVRDTAKATFAVENYEEFVKTQSEAALRHVAGLYPYDTQEAQGAKDLLPSQVKPEIQGGTNAVEPMSLRGSTALVSQELALQVTERVIDAGVDIIEVRISALAYAPEIAQAMLQRQQASAILSARSLIVEGAVTMVDNALERLEAENIVALDDERKAQMVSNLLVVLCSESRATPVVNTGSLYA
ncbi:MAG: SPFH domain-containing protein [Actinomycetaceae bacterium]|nr:SPFH domain-containing protein [Actinomycetaceae bacterium]